VDGLAKAARAGITGKDRRGRKDRRRKKACCREYGWEMRKRDGRSDGCARRERSWSGERVIRVWILEQIWEV
jgi:hypothetical protein